MLQLRTIRNSTLSHFYCRPIDRAGQLLEKLKPGARIVSHAFDMRGIKPSKILPFVSQEDEVERPLYLWMTLLQQQEKKD